MNQEAIAVYCLIGTFLFLGLLMFSYHILELFTKENTKRKAIEALKSNVELKLNSADLKELFK